MHPGDDPAVAARFLGWLQGHGEPLEAFERDTARLTEMLAWDLGPEEAAMSPLRDDAGALRLLALWRDFAPSLPRDWPALGGREPATMMLPPPDPPEPPATAPPDVRRALERSVPGVLAAMARALAAAAVLLVVTLSLALLGVATLADDEPDESPHAAWERTALKSDLDLRTAMAQLLACRREAAARPGISPEVAQRLRRATDELARAAAPLPGASCPAP